MKLALTVFALLTFSAVYCQVECPAVIDWKYLGAVDIYDKPGGETIAQMKNDSIGEDFLHLKIIGQTKTYFHVSVSLAIKREQNKGWIKKADYIGTYIKNESYPMDLELFKSKKTRNSDKIVVTNWTPVLLTIEKYADKLVFVSTKQNGRTYKGWIKLERLCANSYTTCS